MMEKPVVNDEQAETSQTKDAVKLKEDERAEKLDRLAREIFEKRREVFEELAKSYSSDSAALKIKQTTRQISLMACRV